MGLWLLTTSTDAQHGELSDAAPFRDRGCSDYRRVGPFPSTAYPSLAASSFSQSSRQTHHRHCSHQIVGDRRVRAAISIPPVCIRNLIARTTDPRRAERHSSAVGPVIFVGTGGVLSAPLVIGPVRITRRAWRSRMKTADALRHRLDGHNGEVCDSSRLVNGRQRQLATMRVQRMLT